MKKQYAFLITALVLILFVGCTNTNPPHPLEPETQEYNQAYDEEVVYAANGVIDMEAIYDEEAVDETNGVAGAEASEPTLELETETLPEPEILQEPEPAVEAIIESEEDLEELLRWYMRDPPEIKESDINPPPPPFTVPRFRGEFYHPLHGLLRQSEAELVFYWHLWETTGLEEYFSFFTNPENELIYGGMFFHDGALNIFSVDDAAVRAIVDEPLSSNGFEYRLISTPYSAAFLRNLYHHIHDNREVYDIANTVTTGFNLLEVEPRDFDNVSNALQRVRPFDCVNL